MGLLLIPTIRGVSSYVLPLPNALLPVLSDFTLVLPTHSDSSDKTLGVLRYDSGNVSGSEADELYTIGAFTYRYFFVERTAGIDELVMRAPISGSPTTPVPPSGSNDHPRVECRQKTPGPSGHTKGTTEPVGDFLLAENLRFWGLCRPTRFPDRDNAGSTTGANNLTLMQLQPTDGASGALTTFVILALRKDGRLEATMYGADGANAAPGTADDLLTGVALGDLIWWEISTSATQVVWRAENRTQAPGVIQTLTIIVPNTSAGGVGTRTRYYAKKWGCYLGTNVVQSSDDIAGKRVAGVVAHSDVTDYAEVRYREVGFEYLP